MIRGKGRGVGAGRLGMGPPGKCRCPKCGYETTHLPGVPCRSQNCPKCSVPLMGKD